MTNHTKAPIFFSSEDEKRIAIALRFTAKDVESAFGDSKLFDDLRETYEPDYPEGPEPISKGLARLAEVFEQKEE